MLAKKLLKAKLFLFISIAVLIITISNIVVGYLFLSGPLESEKAVIIKKDLSIHKISKLLEEEGIIKNRLLFEIASKFYSYYEPIKSGEYKFTSYVSPYQVIRKLSVGKSVIHRLFIPEGYTVNQIIDKINSEKRLFGNIIGNIPEGYLMPSTYFYSYGDRREEIVDIMRNQMSSALDSVMKKLPPESPLKTRRDVLILASIVEKEAGHDAERGKVAAVFINRLKRGMKLQADPTTIYAITLGKYKLKRHLTTKDLKTPSEYNTYHSYGLPPGPISCPGLASLESVVSPDKTNALYFVADGKGGHNFSSTLKQHNNYVRAFRARKKQSK